MAKAGQKARPDPVTKGDIPTGSGSWSVQNAVGWSAILPDINKNNQDAALLNFLSLYAVTQSGSANGTWDNLSLVNGENRSSLFGSGTEDARQLIQHVWIGDKATSTQQAPDHNPYTGINAVLNQIGFSANGLSHAPTNGHETHFHIDLRPPQCVDLPHNLLASGATTDQSALTVSAVAAQAQTTLDQVRKDLNLTGEVTMLMPDMPNVPPQNVPMMIAQANQAQAGDRATMRTVGVCFPAPNSPDHFSLENVLSPKGEAGEYLRSYEHVGVPYDTFATVTVLQQPAHGILRQETQAEHFGEGRFDSSDPSFAYLPKDNYLGQDKAIFLVDFGNGLKVKVVYFLQAVEGSTGGNDWEQTFCSETGYRWKISSNLDANGNSAISSVEYISPVSISPDNTLTSDSLSAWLSLAQLDAKVADMTSLMSSINVGSSTDSGITVNVADLSGAAVGQTTGANITLDTNAAGNGWFVDTTPADNSEFLPTADPNVWMAKADSAAAGKMDMLSVLLHEYGHALGIEHSADPNDFMNATLQSGEHQR